MATHRSEFEISTTEHDAVYDVTSRVARIVASCGISDGIVCVYTPHATAAVTVNENDDPNIGVDLMRALRKIVPDHDGWLHDRIDDNAAAHIKSALIGPSVTIPVAGRKMCLGRWQNVFLCELDGPRRERRVIVTVVN